MQYLHYVDEMETLEGSLDDGPLKESIAKDPNKLKMFAKVLLHSQYNDYSMTLNTVYVIQFSYYINQQKLIHDSLSIAEVHVFNKNLMFQMQNKHCQI